MLLSEKTRAKPEFHAALGRLSEMKHDMATAEHEWARAAEIAPNDTAYRFQLALTRLSLNDATKRTEALRALEELRSDPAQRAPATRILLIDSVARRGDPQRIRTLANELQAYPESMFSDRIMYLEILRQLHDAAYDEYLSQLKSEVPAKASDLAALISWMTRNRMNDEAIAYANSLPADDVDEMAGAPGAGRYLRAAKGLGAAGKASAHGQLVGLQSLAARLSRARVARTGQATRLRTRVGHGAERGGGQSATVIDADADHRRLGLAKRSDRFALGPDKKSGNETSGVADALRSLHESGRHLRPLPDAEQISRSCGLTTPALQNNLAQVSLLLGVDLDYARKMAADLKEKEPDNAAYASTYAFSLLSKGDVKGALQVMDNLNEEQLRDPSVATYYGVILAAAGQKDKARAFLQRSAEASLLPEEKTLVTRAQSSLE